MIKKILFPSISVFLLLLFCIPFSEAYEITVLKSSDIKPYNDALAGFKSVCECNLNELTIGESNHDDLMSRIIQQKPDAVLAVGMDALRHAAEIKDIPVIYTMVPNPFSVTSDRKNISGVSMFISPARQLDAILEIFPNSKRIGIIYDPKNMHPSVHEAQNVARSKGFELVLRKAARPGEVPALIDSMKDRIDVLWMLPDTTVINPETVKLMLLFSFQNRVPVLTFSKKYVEMGAVAALNIDPFDLGVQAGEIAKKLFLEKNVRTPIRVDARKTVLIINKKIAGKMGVKIREDVLKRAENVD